VRSAGAIETATVKIPESCGTIVRVLRGFCEGSAKEIVRAAALATVHAVVFATVVAWLES
jgi:TctA family transporter